MAVISSRGSAGTAREDSIERDKRWGIERPIEWGEVSVRVCVCYRHRVSRNQRSMLVIPVYIVMQKPINPLCWLRLACVFIIRGSRFANCEWKEGNFIGTYVYPRSINFVSRRFHGNVERREMCLRRIISDEML